MEDFIQRFHDNFGNVLGRDGEVKIMKDVIDERNERERISKSIVKYWNVNYIPQPPMQQAENESNAEQAAENTTGEVGSVAEEDMDEMYNIATGAYSGVYGQNEVEDAVTKGQIDKILHEKTDALRDLIENVDEDMGEK